MNKEDLLQKIREDNQKNEPLEKEVSLFTWKIGAAIAVGLSFVIFYLEWLCWGNLNCGLFTSVSLLLAVKFIIQAIKLKKASSIIFATIFSACFVGFAIVYIIAFKNGWL